ncbi:MAG TPA: MBOAT family O-acyltransferase, partial [Bacillota bacterium]|nr:MBOAT family O-acyltransferase [Bacillota bacterium]
MVFSSLVFLFFFLAVNIAVYYVVPVKARNAVLLVTSIAFYGWGEPLYIAVMIYSVLVAYVLGYFVGKHRQTNKKRARLCMIVSTVLNLAALLFFKYTNFFAETFGLEPIESFTMTNGAIILTFTVLLSACAAAALLLGKRSRARAAGAISIGIVAAAAVLFYFIFEKTGAAGAFLYSEYTVAFTLPIGISFYTFQIMSYTFDIYRGDADAQKSIVPFAAYVTLFPQLIAGPIVRYKDIDSQLSSRTVSIDKFARGVRTFTAGLAKKLILADGCAVLYDYLCNVSSYEPTVLGAWAAVICFSFQIYFDFSGYSDMAIGL